MLNLDSQKLRFHWGLNKDFTAVVEQFELLTHFITRGNTMSCSSFIKDRFPQFKSYSVKTERKLDYSQFDSCIFLIQTLKWQYNGCEEDSGNWTCVVLGEGWHEVL